MVVIRRRGFPLLRGAMIGGVGYAAGRRSAANAQREESQSSAIAGLQTQQPAAPQQAPAGPADTPEITAQLAQLGQLAQQGLLSPEEFAAAKAKLLGT